MVNDEASVPDKVYDNVSLSASVLIDVLTVTPFSSTLMIDEPVIMGA